MTAEEFFVKVSEMRKAQRSYFKTRTSIDLQRSKRLEREIDNEIKRVSDILQKRSTAGTPDLFAGDEE